MKRRHLGGVLPFFVAAAVASACASELPVSEKLIIEVSGLPDVPASVVGTLDLHLFDDQEPEGSFGYTDLGTVVADAELELFAYDLTDDVAPTPNATFELVAFAYTTEGQVRGVARATFGGERRGVIALSLQDVPLKCDDDGDGLLDCLLSGCCGSDDERAVFEDLCPETLDPTCDAAEEVCEGMDWEGVALGDFCAPPGVCDPGTVICQVGTEGASASCSSLQLAADAGGPGDEACDTLDNDCDGVIDEDFSSQLGQACLGMGACGDGVQECSGAGLICSTTHTSGSDYGGSSEECNALDDDCDGAIDEGFDPNTDGDELPDCSDQDDDNDGVLDEVDNCPKIDNAGQEDLDGDQLGDDCDDDYDGDSVDDEKDNCVGLANTNQLDNDGDDEGDACDLDDDNDGVQDTGDNCPLDANGPNEEGVSQADLDGDGMGDVCDPDLDGDEIKNENDQCPTIYDPVEFDTDGDGTVDCADEDDDDDGVMDGPDCAPLDEAIYPGAKEICDGKDNDCDDETPLDSGVLCDDGDPCTDDSCAGTEGCTNPPNTDDCDDGNPCTEADKCAAGSCFGVQPMSCDDGSPCTYAAGECDPAQGGCVYINVTNGLSCDDGDACTENEACAKGKCEGSPTDCDDDNPCTDDYCSVLLGCFYENSEDFTQCGASDIDRCRDGACVTCGGVTQDGECGPTGEIYFCHPISESFSVVDCTEPNNCCEWSPIWGMATCWDWDWDWSGTDPCAECNDECAAGDFGCSAHGLQSWTCVDGQDGCLERAYSPCEKGCDQDLGTCGDTEVVPCENGEKKCSSNGSYCWCVGDTWWCFHCGYYLDCFPDGVFDNSCPGPADGTAICIDGGTCIIPAECNGGANCAGKACGSDGCGGTCGSCSDGEQCLANGDCATVDCAPGLPVCNPEGAIGGVDPGVFQCTTQGAFPDFSSAIPVHQCSEGERCQAPTDGGIEPADYCEPPCAIVYADALGTPCDGDDVGLLCQGALACPQNGFGAPVCDEAVANTDQLQEIIAPIALVPPIETVVTGVAVYEMTVYAVVEDGLSATTSIHVYQLPADSGDDPQEVLLIGANQVIDIAVDKEMMALAVLLASGEVHIYDVADPEDPIWVRSFTKASVCKGGDAACSSLGQVFTSVTANDGLIVLGLEGTGQPALAAFFTALLVDSDLGNTAQDLNPIYGSTFVDGALTGLSVTVDLSGLESILMVTASEGACYVTSFVLMESITFPSGAEQINSVYTAPCFKNAMSAAITFDLGDGGTSGVIVGPGRIDELATVGGEGWFPSWQANALYDGGASNSPMYLHAWVQEQPGSSDQTAFVVAHGIGLGPEVSLELMELERWNLASNQKVAGFDIQLEGTPEDIDGWTAGNTTWVAIAAGPFGLHLLESTKDVSAGSNTPITVPPLLGGGAAGLDAGGIAAWDGWTYVAAGNKGVIPLDGTSDPYSPVIKDTILVDHDVRDVIVLENVLASPGDGGFPPFVDVAIFATDEGLLAMTLANGPTAPVDLWSKGPSPMEHILLEMPHLYASGPDDLRIVELDTENLGSDPVDLDPVSLPGIEDMEISKGRLFLLANGQIFSFDVGGWGAGGAAGQPIQKVGGSLSIPAAGGAIALDLAVLEATGDGESDLLLVAADTGGLYAAELTDEGPGDLEQVYGGDAADLEQASHVFTLGESVFLVGSAVDMGWARQLLWSDGNMALQWNTQIGGPVTSANLIGGVLYTLTAEGALSSHEVACE